MLKPIIAFCLLSALISSCNITAQVSGPVAVIKNRAIMEKCSGNDKHSVAFPITVAQSNAVGQWFLATKMEPQEKVQAE